MDKRATLDKEELFRQRVEGLTYAEIASHAGISRQRVQQILAPPAAVYDLVVRRQNGLCQGCGINSIAGGHIHHVSITHASFEDYTDIPNLVLLCRSCHRSVHWGTLEVGLPPLRGEDELAIGTVMTRAFQCSRCERVWLPLRSSFSSPPKHCPQCGSRLWNRPRSQQASESPRHDKAHSKG